MSSMRDLSKYDHSLYRPGRNRFVITLWNINSVLFFRNALFPFYGFKRALLRCFGAKVGKKVVIKPCVIIKYPWHLSIGDHSWIGEKVWIENAGDITIGANCCVSQGAMLLSGNHDFTKDAFDPFVKPIVLKDGVWVGTKAVVCPGVTMGEDSVLAVNSVLTKDTSPRSVWQGNPAEEKKIY